MLAEAPEKSVKTSIERLPAKVFEEHHCSKSASYHGMSDSLLEELEIAYLFDYRTIRERLDRIQQDRHRHMLKPLSNVMVAADPAS